MLVLWYPVNPSRNTSKCYYFAWPSAELPDLTTVCDVYLTTNIFLFRPASPVYSSISAGVSQRGTNAESMDCVERSQADMFSRETLDEMNFVRIRLV